MKIQSLIISGFLLILIIGCNPLKQMQSHQDSIEEAYNAGNYQQALTAFDELSNYHSSKESEVELKYIKMAAQSAIELQQNQQAEELLQQWINKSEDLEAIELLASVYQKAGKTDKEYDLWNQHWDKIESQDKKKEVGSRLFTIEMDREEYEKALERVNEMPPLSDPRTMFMRVEALDATGQDEEAREVCNKLLEKHPDYAPALEWKGKDIYDRAEAWYKSEMKKYDENPEYTAYVYLRRELKKISSMFRQSRDIFEKLHQDNPENNSYIKYLKNIYIRLEMREEAAKMDMLLENQ